MKISQVEIYKYSIPMVPFTIATGTMEQAQNLFIRVHTDGGITGVGECSAFPMIAGETQATCFAMARDFAALWKHKDPLAIAQRLEELDLFTAGNYTAKSAFDLALYDIAAKAAGQPLYAYLGGKQKLIESDLTIGIDTPEKMAETAVSFREKKVNIIKVKLGKKPADDIERIRQIRTAAGSGIRLRIDANQGWSYEDALFALQSLEPYGIEFCEQPMRKWNDELLPELCRLSPIPIMADESVFTHHDAERLIRNRACDFINIKFAKSGGIQEARKINAVAEKNKIPCMLGGMLESRVALTAKVHFAMAHDNIRFYDLDTCLLGHLTDPVTGGVTYSGMQLQLADTPGIGADVDEAYLAKLEKAVV
ncbi:mandelate racemase/muconate lactonizing enzyme family protein [Sediminibacterium soli]|uniref:mandelate racemase/muconate lactonizing enzyme family protein n=1 Tax=Sediminibacterium soli TaxID=2698829 RepID=UPI00137AA5A9|nr:dipeptide epimerase [Sediminibacterium soli]NCI47155.1 dipeptide epimerase [Sediminibacterium soli]